jgi:glycosyltransferase involved in cell wall biosynthesis
MKVCHVCSAHTVDDGRVFHRACVSLAEAGYDVHLVACGEGNEPYCERGVTVHPLPKASSRRKRLARRSYVARIAAELRPDLFHVHEPELLGPVLAQARARPVIWDVHESYLDVLMEREWIPRRLRPLACTWWDKQERWLLRRCAGVVVVTERIAQRYYPLSRRVVVVANYPDLSALENLPAPKRDGRTCVFAGVIMPDRGLLQVIQAMGLLRKHGQTIRLALAGPVAKDYLDVLMDEAGRQGVKDWLTYHGVLTKAEAIRLQNEASIGLVPYLPVPNSMASMANKLLECMALRLPLVFSDFPNYQEIAGSSGAGIAVDPTRPEQIAKAIDYLVKNPRDAQRMGEDGRRAVQERFNWSVERAKLLELYREILGSPRGDSCPSPS